MKHIKRWILSIMILAMVMSVPMASTSFAAAKDYATLSWVTSLVNVESSQASGPVRITITGVVGKQISKGVVDFAKVPDAYYYEEGPSVGVYYEEEILTVMGYENGELVEIPVPNLSKAIETTIDLAERNRCEKVDVKLIPIVEGATMKIELVGAPALFYYQYNYPGFPGTQPLLLTEVERRKSFFFEMWSDENPVETRTFKKIVDNNGTFRVYQFPREVLPGEKGPLYFGRDPEPKAFYVVTEAEAKALMGKSGTLPVQKPIITALPTSSKVLVDGTNVSFEAYNINGNNYFKLRDLAKVVSGSEKQFEVGWDGVANAIRLTSNKGYTTVGGELVLSGNTQNKSATATTSTLYLDGKAISLTAYNIGGNNYFKLRDVGKTFNFGIGYDNSTKVITIDTTLDYED